MRFDPRVHHRRSIRLQECDYSQIGAYFVTVCVQDRECLFGGAVDGEMRLNDLGEVVERCWLWLAERHRYVELDAFVVMPNHLHGVIVISDERVGDRPGSGDASVGEEGGSRPEGGHEGGRERSRGRSRGRFTNRPYERRGRGERGEAQTVGPVDWGVQDGVDPTGERDPRHTRGDALAAQLRRDVIRDDADLARIRRYIADNPANWARDADNPRSPRRDEPGHPRS